MANVIIYGTFDLFSCRASAAAAAGAERSAKGASLPWGLTPLYSMSPNRRILLNIVATYGRSLYALVIGLFCGRWMLMAVGEVDMG